MENVRFALTMNAGLLGKYDVVWDKTQGTTFPNNFCSSGSESSMNTLNRIEVQISLGPNQNRLRYNNFKIVDKTGIDRK